MRSSDIRPAHRSSSTYTVLKSVKSTGRKMIMYRQNPMQNILGGLMGFPGGPGGPGFPGGGPFPGPGGPGPFPGPGGPGGPGPFPGPGIPGPGGQGAPGGPPPSYIPPKPGTGPGFSVQAINPGAIVGCRFRYVYIWQSNGDAYWAYLTFVGRNSVAGFRWTGFNWVYFGLDTRFIDQFTCI
ncbi:MAG: hypothetical protein K0R57_2572 [Paenibacillaceae bacterium]|nr:hypothetical protein [Paenibacillaceae bacterium]